MLSMSIECILTELFPSQQLISLGLSLFAADFDLQLLHNLFNRFDSKLQQHLILQVSALSLFLSKILQNNDLVNYCPNKLNR